MVAILEEELQRKLNLARPVDLGADHAEIGRPDLATGISEPRAVKGIEELGAELRIEPAVPEFIVLEETGVPVVDSADPNVGRGPRGIPEGECGGPAEGGSIEP